MDTRTIIAVALAGFALFAVAAKLLPAPLGVFIVPTRSMVPVIEPGDMVVVYGRSVSPGDIVVWCRGPLYCVVHRLVELRDGYMVTKGDANPLPDNPVPLSSLKGRVVAVVPRYVWLPALAVAVAYVVAPSIRSLARAEASPYLLVAGILGFYTVSAIAATLLQPAMSIAVLGQARLPVLYLAKASIDDRGCSLVLGYQGLHGLHLARVEELLVAGEPVEAILLGNDTIVAYIPPRLLAEAVQGDGARLHVVVEAGLTRMARLHGEYTVPVPFKPLVARVENGSLVVLNPNCYPLEANITILYASGPGEPWQKETLRVVLRDRYVAGPPPGARYAYALVEYRALGHTHAYRLRLR